MRIGLLDCWQYTPQILDHLLLEMFVILVYSRSCDGKCGLMILPTIWNDVVTVSGNVGNIILSCSLLGGWQLSEFLGLLPEFRSPLGALRWTVRLDVLDEGASMAS